MHVRPHPVLTSRPTKAPGFVDVLRQPGVRVAVFRALYLGDLLCAIPAVRALRRLNADMHLTLIGLGWAQEFASLYPSYFDAFVPVPSIPGLHDPPFDLESFENALQTLRSQNFDVVIQMHGSGPQSNIVARQIPATGSNRTPASP